MDKRVTTGSLLLCCAIYAGSACADVFTVTSKDISSDRPMGKNFVFKGFGCDGENLSPQLSWSNPPEGTKSFAVTAYDPDAPTGSGWWHWLVVNIPATTTELKQGAGDISKALLPAGTLQTRTDYGTQGYGGPCPPEGHGAHRYQFKVYALGVDKLPLQPEYSGAMVGFYLNGNALDTATLEVKYSR